MSDRKGPQRPLATDEDEPEVGRAVDTIAIIVVLVILAIGGWWLTLEPSEHESGMWCIDLGRCDND